ncbi:B3 domain-containing transcription factor VRN1 [Linum perenne]
MASLSETKPRFFIIILQTTISSRRLMIPNSFSTKHFGKDEWPTSATLRIPSGLFWEVELLKTRGDQPDVWIHGSAWEQFVSCHNLKQGHFILFQYEGDSLFTIFVFGLSGCEIRYPCCRVVPEEDEEAAEFQHVDEDDDISVEIISKMKEEEADQCDEDYVSVENFPDLDAGPSRRRTPPYSVTKSRKQRRKKTDSSSNHPSFSVVIQRSYLERRLMTIPKEFRTKHLMLKEQIIKLQVANCDEKNQHWLVEVRTAKGSRGEMYLKGGGWSDFAKTNCLQIGDVCEFEMIGFEENLRVLQVSISRR